MKTREHCFVGVVSIITTILFTPQIVVLCFYRSCFLLKFASV